MLGGGATDSEIRKYVKSTGTGDKYEYNWDNVTNRVESHPLKQKTKSVSTKHEDTYKSGSDGKFTKTPEGRTTTTTTYQKKGKGKRNKVVTYESRNDGTSVGKRINKTDAAGNTYEVLAKGARISPGRAGRQMRRKDKKYKEQ